MTYNSTITTKGTITLPAEFRKQFGLSAGKKVTMEVSGDKLIIKAPLSIDDIRARNQAHLKKRGLITVTDKTVDKVTAEAAIERYRRSVS